MKIKYLMSKTVAGLLLGLFTQVDAYAATAVVKCTDTGTTRSSISVAGAGMSAGNYFAVVGTDGRAYRSGVKATNSLGRISFLFDSNPIAGTTRIAPNFIHNGLPVYGYIREAATSRFVAAIGAYCAKK